MKKSSKAYKTIGEVAEILELDSIGNKKNTHTIRYWEKEFKQIKPIIINKRRHYDDKNIDVLKKRVITEKKKEALQSKIIILSVCLSIGILGYFAG
mgnify:CR=1 FL=1